MADERPWTAHREPSPDRALDRRRWCLGAASLLGLTACGTRPVAPDSGTGAATRVPPFSTAPLAGGLPAGWRNHVVRRDLPPTRFEPVQRDGRVVMHARADASTAGLRCDVDLDPHRTPWLSWEWQVDQVPLDATVADDDLDDSPARLVLGFDGDMSSLSLRDQLFNEQVELFTGNVLPYATLAYVWDGKATPMSVFRYPRSSRIRYLVVESGATNTGRWLGYRRNVLDDYRRVFGAEPGRIRSVGVLSDSDDLKHRSQTWFADIVIG